MNYKQVESFSEEKPLEIDTTSSESVVYLRRNIESVPNTDSTGEETDGTHWKMEEAQLTRVEYEEYKKIREILKNQTEIIANQEAQDAVLAELLLAQL